MRHKEIDGLYIRAPRLNRLNILRMLSGDSRLTQAELARRSGLSVAMVNNYMKDLCSAGLLEYRRKSSRTVTYHLTDAGRAHEESLQQELIDELVTLFAEAKERVREHILSRAKAPIHSAVLLGSGSLAELACHAMRAAGIRVLAICDTDARGRDCCGQELLDVSLAHQLAPDAVIVADCRATAPVLACLRFFGEQGVPVVCVDGDRISPSVGCDSSMPDLAAVNG